MSELSEQYLLVLSKAARLRQRFKEANPDGDIEKSESFLAEDWRICVEQLNALTTELYKEHFAEHGYPYKDCAPQLRRGSWRRNPSVRKQIHGNHSIQQSSQRVDRRKG